MYEGESPSPVPTHLLNQLSSFSGFHGIKEAVFVQFAGLGQGVQIELPP